MMYLVMLSNSQGQVYLVGNSKGLPWKSELVARNWAKKYNTSTFKEWHAQCMPLNPMGVGNAPIKLGGWGEG